MSIIKNSAIGDKGLEGMNALRQLLKQKGIKTQKESPNKNKLLVKYTRCNVHGEEVAPEGTIFYFADITLYDEFGHPNTGTTLFHVNVAVEEQKGQQAVEAELNQICLTKMRAAVNLHRNSQK